MSTAPAIFNSIIVLCCIFSCYRHGFHQSVYRHYKLRHVGYLCWPIVLGTVEDVLIIGYMTLF
ncbi:Uncharacterised protein [Segatella copri]|nr:Uncharacterised protein [Segatella copri]